MRVMGLSGPAQSYFLARFLSGLHRPCFVVLPSSKDSERLYKELYFFMSQGKSTGAFSKTRLHSFPAYDITPLTGLSPHREIVTKRLQALYCLISNPNPVIITSLEALAHRIVPKEAFVRSLEYMEAGESVDRDHFLRKIEAAGFQRVALVEEEGDYAVRGGVIDLYPPLHPLPVRLEFWGDRVESIRYFHPLSQRSQRTLKEVVILPASEIIRDEPNMKRARSMGRLPEAAEGGTSFPGQEAWLNHFYDRPDALFDYLPPNSLVVRFDSHLMSSAYEKIWRKFIGDADKFRHEAGEKGVPFPELEGILLSYEETMEGLGKHQCVEFGSLNLSSPERDDDLIHVKGEFRLHEELGLKLAGKGRVSMGPLAEKIDSWVSSGAKIVLVTRTEQQANRLVEILESYGVSADGVAQYWDEIPPRSGFSVCIGRLPKGFLWPEIGLYVISEDEIFGPKRARTGERIRPRGDALAWSSISQLKAGDLVVHEEHGIGRYGGLIKMEVQNRVNDFVLVEYNHKDRLYIPADRISVLQKYIGADQKEPKLDRLGGNSWNAVKKRARKSVKAIAKQLVELYALRKYRKGFAFSPPDNYFREFEATFEHEETLDQAKAIEDVLADMTSERPMDRLICGDVGFGKTEVALRAAFKAVADGKQVALLVPTTVLAEQHYKTFTRRMAPCGISVGILSRFKTRAEQLETLRSLRSGKIDIIIGTHRILQKDVRFRDLGLLIVDEEQRFGVKQKEALKKYRSLVDVLAITATPIPRTLHMSMMGVRDLSIIETPPEDRLAIQSYLSPYDEALIARAIRFELERGGQVFFVHNRVQGIDKEAERLKRLVPEARFAVAHGQMKERELERTMIRFIENEIDVLVCTTIIESGLDIPSANTIIINEVDQMGLAQVYQLRGRVGRAAEKAYAYLLLSEGAVLTRDAEKRLKALMDFSHLGAGLHLAMHDLKIRGGGNILGFAQSGQISAVGYELYLKLVEQAIAELKGEEWQEEVNPEIHMDMTAYLPSNYVSDPDLRLNLYRRLSGLRRESELEALKIEVKDRFGPAGQEVENLFALMSLRILLKEMAIHRLDVGGDSITLTFSQNAKIDPDYMVRMVHAKDREFRLIGEYKLQIRTGPVSLPADLPKIRKAIEELRRGSSGRAAA